MNNVMKQLILISALIFFSQHAQAQVREVVRESFTIEEQAALKLENINGDVTIRSWQQSEILVVATISAQDQQSFDRVEVVMEQQGNRVFVKSDYKEDSWFGSKGNSARVEYQVNVPENTDLENIELVNGSLTVEQVNGDFEANLVNGSLLASGLGEEVKVDSVNGKIELRFTNDAIDLEQVNIDSVNGAIRLYLPTTTDAKVNVSTQNGHLSSDFGLTVDKEKYFGNEMHGQIGNGQGKILIETVNGSIKLLKL